jgi:hypothetical protein
MNDIATPTHAGPNLRQLSRQFSEGKLSFNEYRAARQRLLDDIARGAVTVNAYQAASLPSATRQVESPSLNDTQPTIPYNRPRVQNGWKIALLIALLAIAVIAGVVSQ